MIKFNLDKSLILLILLFFIILILVGPEIAPLLKLQEFLHNPITVVSLLIIFAITLKLEIEKKGLTDFRFIPEALLVASTIGLLLEVPHISSIFRDKEEKEQITNIRNNILDLNKKIDFLYNEKKQALDIDISGDWLYEVQNEYGYITHGGISTIKVSSGEIFIDGYRKYIQHSDTKIETQLDSIPNNGNYWFTNFVAVTGVNEVNKKIHFVYTIVLKGETKDSPVREVRGYCVLVPKKEKGNDVIKELNGTYTHLAPGALSGFISFKKMEKDDALEFINKKIKESKGHLISHN